MNVTADNVTPFPSNYKFNDADILHQALTELGFKIEYKLTPKERGKLSQHLYTKYGWQQQRIANALHVSQSAIRNDLSGLVESTKPHRPKGGRPKGRKGKRGPPVHDDKAKEIIALSDKGLTPKEIAPKVGVVLRRVTAVIREEQFRRKGEDGIDPTTLAPSAQAKLEAAKRQQQRNLETQFEERVRNLDEEVRQRVLKENKEYLEMVKEREAKARDDAKLYQEMTSNYRPLFTLDQFNLIRKCLHQSGVAATAKDFDAAFDLIQKKKLQLTGQK